MIVNAILEVFVILFFFGQTLEKRQLDNKYKFITIAVITTIHILRSFIPFNTYTNILITAVLWLGFAVVLFKDSIVKKIIMFLIYMFVIIVCDVLSRYITVIIFDTAYNTLSAVGVRRYVFMIVNISLYFVILSYIAMFAKRRNYSITLKYWIMMLLFPMFSLFIIISFDKLIILSGINDIKYIVLLLLTIIGFRPKRKRATSLPPKSY